MSKTYETELDRVREDLIAGKLAHHYGMEQFSMPQFSSVDRVFTVDDKVRAMVEIRGRDHICGTYDNIWIAKDKYRHLVWLGRMTKVPVVFAVQFHDVLAFVDIMKLGGLRITEGGYTNGGREDYSNAIEQVAQLPVTKFHKYLNNEEIYSREEIAIATNVKLGGVNPHDK